MHASSHNDKLMRVVPDRGLPALHRMLHTLKLATLGFRASNFVLRQPRFSHPQRAIAAAAMGKDNLHSAKIIPDVVDGVSEHSAARLHVLFGGKAVDEGNHMTPDETASTPDVKILSASNSEMYTLVCTDPDAPDPKNPIRREFLHWVVTNIQRGDVSTGQEITPYVGPRPPIGIHRYIFLLFTQPSQEPLQVADPSQGDLMRRAKFSTRKFAQEHNLGQPVDVKWFNAQASK